MKNLYFVTLLLFAFPAFSVEIQGYKINSASGDVDLTLNYQGSCEEHHFSINFSPECDDEGAVAGRISDSGFADTCISDFKTANLTLNLTQMNLSCTPKILYIFAAPRRVPFRIQL